MCLFWTLQAFWKKKKKRICRTPSWHHNCEHVWSLNRRSRIRTGICISCAQNVFQTPTWDYHPVLIYVASTLHHARPRPKTTIGLCVVPSEADIDPLCGSTNWFVSNQRGFEWIHEKKKLHQKARERKNPPAWRCFALDLSWWHHRCLWQRWIQWWILQIGVYSQRGPWCKGLQVGSEPTPIAMKWLSEHFMLQNANFCRS